MIAGRILYRTRQLWNALRGRPSCVDLERIRQTLTEPQWSLFTRMQPGEQAHSIQVYQALIRQGETHPDLLAAALLHDAGKSRAPLRAGERVIIVAVKAFFPDQAKQWGSAMDEGSLRSWKRPWIIAEQHPAWGAELARQAGASPLTVALIRKHQETAAPTAVSTAKNASQGKLEDQLLYKLQAVDDES